MTEELVVACLCCAETNTDENTSMPSVYLSRLNCNTVFNLSKNVLSSLNHQLAAVDVTLPTLLLYSGLLSDW